MVQPNGQRTLIATALFFAASFGVSPARGEPIFKADVKVDGSTLGTFAIDVYQEASAGDAFGIAIRGGFNPVSTDTLPPGYTYRWVQTVTSSAPAYSWQNAGAAYVDRLRDADSTGELTLAQLGTPFYGGGIVGPNGQYELPFADSPSRETSLSKDFQGTWALSLVAVADRTTPGDFNEAIPGANRLIYQLATFVWGFNAAKQTDGSFAVSLLGIREVPLDAETLIGAFARDPDRATFGGGAWDIRSGLPGTSPGVVPEPSSMLLALSAIVAIGLPIHRARRRRAG